MRVWFDLVEDAGLDFRARTKELFLSRISDLGSPTRTVHGDLLESATPTRRCPYP